MPRIAALIFVGLQLAFSALDGALACESGSVPIFSCEASGGKKYIELCASSPVVAPYEVFTEARGMATIAAGVRVREVGGGKAATVACSERPRFYIHELKGLVACDPQTPVGRACIE